MTELAQQFQAAQYAALSFGRFRVVVPLQDLHSLEPVLDVDTQQRNGHGIGSIELRDGCSTRVYCLDELFSLCDAPPSDQRICAVLDDGAESQLCLVCGTVEALSGEVLTDFPMPACMTSTATPLAGLALLAGRVVGRTSGAALAQFVAAGSAAAAEAICGVEQLLDGTLV